MIVWGGCSVSANVCYNDGARYDPASDTWSPVSMVGAPATGGSPAGVWTGSRLFVWGGYLSPPTNYSNEAGRYDPVADVWTLSSSPSFPFEGAPESIRNGVARRC